MNTLLTWLHSSWQWLWAFAFAHFFTVLIIIVLLIILGKMFHEKRAPANIFAWAFFILLVPILGIPLYFIFGGRKSRRHVRNKKRVLEVASQIADTQASPHKSPLAAITSWEANSFELLADGHATYKALIEEIRNAKQSISITTYILGSDSSARSVIAELVKAARRGVQVRLLIDGLGSIFKILTSARPLMKAGGKVARFIPVWPIQTKTSANLRNHRKVAIFDDQRVIIGGQNIDNRFLATTPHQACFTDFSALIEGPLAKGLNQIFVSDWCYANEENPLLYKDKLQATTKPVGTHTFELIPAGPDWSADPIWEHFITLVQEAQESITIVTPYFVPDEVLFRSLIVKAHSGKKITLIVPEKSNQRLADFARNHYLRALHDAGVSILLYTAGMIHGKLFFVDDKTVVFGSANMDIRSLFVNFEINLASDSPEVVKQLQTWKDALLPHCIAYEETTAPSVSRKRALMEDFAHLLVPML